jgi:hypothetical protein
LPLDSSFQIFFDLAEALTELGSFLRIVLAGEVRESSRVRAEATRFAEAAERDLLEARDP